MPSYEYDCKKCGGFSAMRPMAEFALPADCPGCGDPAPRALTVPAFAGMDSVRRVAAATNERSANAPARHSPGCGCCRPAQAAAGGVKGFPGRRPWMISH